MNCCKCQGPLDTDGVGATQRFVNRKATEFFCVSCLAQYLGVTEDYLKERINFLKEAGCGMFPDSKRK